MQCKKWCINLENKRSTLTSACCFSMAFSSNNLDSCISQKFSWKPKPLVVILFFYGAYFLTRSSMIYFFVKGQSLWSCLFLEQTDLFQKLFILPHRKTEMLAQRNTIGNARKHENVCNNTFVSTTLFNPPGTIFSSFINSSMSSPWRSSPLSCLLQFLLYLNCVMHFNTCNKKALIYIHVLP